VFWCNSRRNNANRQSKTSEDLRRPWEKEIMKIQAESEDVTKGGIIFPSSKISYMEANTQKDECTWWGAWRKLLGVWHLKLCTHAPSSCSLRTKALFCVFLVEKPGILAQVQVETLPINNVFLIHYFSFRMKCSKGRQALETSREEFLSSLQLFLRYVLFLFL